MTLQLTGENEKRIIEKYKIFKGMLINQMPLLVGGKDEKGNIVDVPRVPISFAQVIERRMNAPEDVRCAWQKHYFFTGDGSVAGPKGDNLIVLDAQHLRNLTTESELYNGALVLSGYIWNELKEQKEKVLYLTAEEVEEVYEGYIRKSGVLIPANRTVGKVWDMLNRGRNLNDYVQLVREKSPTMSCSKLLKVYLRITESTRPVMNSLIIRAADCYSTADGCDCEFNERGRGFMIGVAPEARESPLESKVKLSLQQRTNFELNC